MKADLGGRIDKDGIFSYRLNALYGSGDGYVDQSHQRRALGDLGLDIRPWEHGVLELNYSDYSLTDKGYPGWFTYGETIDAAAGAGSAARGLTVSRTRASICAPVWRVRASSRTWARTGISSPAS